MQVIFLHFSFWFSLNHAMCKVSIPFEQHRQCNECLIYHIFCIEDSFTICDNFSWKGQPLCMMWPFWVDFLEDIRQWTYFLILQMIINPNDFTESFISKNTDELWSKHFEKNLFKTNEIENKTIERKTELTDLLFYFALKSWIDINWTIFNWWDISLHW